MEMCLIKGFYAQVKKKNKKKYSDLVHGEWKKQYGIELVNIINK